LRKQASRVETGTVTSLADPAAPPAASGSVWRAPGLSALFTASTTARLANEAARVAIVLLVLSRTSSPALAGTVVGALALPALVTGPVLGAWLDRTARRRSVFVANQLLLLIVLVALLGVTGTAPSYVVVGLGLLAGVTAPVLTGGFTGLIAPLVPSVFLRRAYGAEATSYNVAAVAGPALAGALAAAFSPDVAVAATAAASLAALVAVLRVPMPAPAADPSRAALVRTVLEGLRLLVTVPALRSITLATTVSFTGMGALPVVFPLLAEEVGQQAAAGGALFSAFALGALLGSLAVASRSPRTGPMRMAFAGIVGLAVAFTAVAFAPSFPVAVVLVVVAGALEGPVLASTLAVRALHTPAHMQTQVVTTAASLKFGGFAVGSAVAGLVVAAYGVRVGIGALAGMQVVALGLGLLARPRSR
jgi:predicted MFS family arabinose efflux permease